MFLPSLMESLVGFLLWLLGNWYGTHIAWDQEDFNEWTAGPDIEDSLNCR